MRRLLRGFVVSAMTLAIALAEPQLAPAQAADFSVSPQVPLAGQTVTFTATGLRPSESVSWDFQSDGSFDATGATAQHVYPTAGQRTVLMRVTKPGSQPPEVVTKAVTVAAPPVQPPPAPPAAPPNRPPVASFNVYPRAPVIGDRVEFVSTASDPESPIARHAWDLDGDGQYDDASGVSASHTFTRSGQHTVGLRVTDARGVADVERRTLLVAARLTSSSSLALMTPFPIVRIVGRATARGTQIRLLLVRGAPRGAKVTVRCRGAGCRVGRQVKYARSGRVRFRALERVMGPGTRIKIFVTRRGRIGKYTAFTIRRMRRPLRRDLCVTSARAKPTRCPS